ncbi:unnamed protein product [Polarella glacialis]|uniref:Uncharacterized protein n=1 Tax=Polarella glacialis TaxID=89957 RepID=A0A813KUX2_POLGL|nr:unnamed protein product [Polarella glacialis]
MGGEADMAEEAYEEAYDAGHQMALVGDQHSEDGPTFVLEPDSYIEDDMVERVARSPKAVRSPSSSSPGLNRSGAMMSPLRSKLNLVAPRLDASGFPRVKPGKPPHTHAWNERHSIGGMDNSLMPKGQRLYFSKSQSLPELRDHLVHHAKHSQTQIQRLDSEEIQAFPPSFVSADAGPPVVPTRHVPGGTMADRDQKLRPWNNRWECGVHMMNSKLHPLHRSGFSTKSLFETSQSQQWRRNQDQEMEKGVWRSIHAKKPSRFGPLGV